MAWFALRKGRGTFRNVRCVWLKQHGSHAVIVKGQPAITRPWTELVQRRLWQLRNLLQVCPEVSRFPNWQSLLFVLYGCERLCWPLFWNPSDTTFLGRARCNGLYPFTDGYFLSSKLAFSSVISPYEGMVIVPFISFMAQHFLWIYRISQNPVVRSICNYCPHQNKIKSLWGFRPWDWASQDCSTSCATARISQCLSDLKSIKKKKLPLGAMRGWKRGEEGA